MRHLKLFEELSPDIMGIFDLERGWIVLLNGYRDGKIKSAYWVAIIAETEYEAVQKFHEHFSQGERSDLEEGKLNWKNVTAGYSFYGSTSTIDIHYEVISVIDGLIVNDDIDTTKCDVISDKETSMEIVNWIRERFSNIEDRIKHIRSINKPKI